MAHKTKTLPTARILQGIPVSEGTAFGAVCLFKDGTDIIGVGKKIRRPDIPREVKRLADALDRTEKKLITSATYVKDCIGREESEIFAAHREILTDPVLKKQLVKSIEINRLSAVGAVVSTMDAYRLFLEDTDNETIQERGQDIEDVKQGILEVLGKTRKSYRCGNRPECTYHTDRIIVIENLSPNMVLELDMEQVRGFVTSRRGVNSHAAILCRAMGIPVVGSIKTTSAVFSCGREILIDGARGTVTIEPTAKAVHARLVRAAAPPEDPGSPEHAVGIMANISTVKDVHSAVTARAEGIGLYRTEFEFLAAGRFLDEDEQYERYRPVVEAMRGKPVSIRMLDIGGDKIHPHWTLEKGKRIRFNLRGTQFLLAHPDILKAQARAIARASAAGPIHVIYPMIIDAEQFRAARDLFNQETRDLETGTIRHGAMFEIPSACIEAKKIFHEADFGSIGTNDLIQYLFGVDREHGLEVFHYVADSATFWDMMKTVARAAQKEGKPLSVCGELARDLKYIKRFRKLNVTAFSVGLQSINHLRRALYRERAGSPGRTRTGGGKETVSKSGRPLPTLDFWKHYLKGR